MPSTLPAGAEEALGLRPAVGKSRPTLPLPTFRHLYAVEGCQGERVHGFNSIYEQCRGQ